MRKTPKDRDLNDLGKYIYRPWITTKSGKRLYAKWFGYKAFRIPVSQ